MATTNLKAAQQLLDLYNAANPDLPHPATLQDIDVYENPMIGGPTEQHNTTSYLFAKEESLYFTSSMSIYYNRLNANITNDEVVGSADDWQNDDFVLAEINKRLQKTWPDDEFVIEELMIGRSETEEGLLQVMVSWANSIKFFPNPDDPNGVIIITVTPTVRDLDRLNGELNGFT